MKGTTWKTVHNIRAFNTYGRQNTDKTKTRWCNYAINRMAKYCTQVRALNPKDNTVVIVESPTKAKKVSKFFTEISDSGSVTVLACYGHIRDLEAKDGAVKPEENFSMKWVLSPKSKEKLDAIQKEVKKANKIFLATDPDREGEGIAWHLQEELKSTCQLDGKAVQRIAFNEVTKNAVQQALSEARDISYPLVDAYRARRALDFLVGFKLSPVLWRRLPGTGRSAGRVQSAALRMICERETEIDVFVPEEYWTVSCKVNAGALPKLDSLVLDANLRVLNGERLSKFSIASEAEAAKAVAKIKASDIFVQNVNETKSKRSPRRPLTTSVLQQLASSRFGMTASETMSIAQKLYEGFYSKDGEGLITYMRTDGTYLSSSFLDSARKYVSETYGGEYLPEKPRLYKSRSKNSQEAHEAIRPTNPWISPESLRKDIDAKAYKVYKLIWSISVASQMKDAIIKTVSIDFGDVNGDISLRSSLSALDFPGHQLLNVVNDDDSLSSEQLAALMVNFKPEQKCEILDCDSQQHHTSPPPRYNDGSLVKALEERGIGRPSTYAPIIHVLVSRTYVIRNSGRFLPTPKGHLVVSFLKHYFGKYVDYDYTSKIEEELDMISNNDIPWLSLLENFWGDFHTNISSVLGIRNREVIDVLDQSLCESWISNLKLDDDDHRQCPLCRTGRTGLKLSMYGGFIGCSNYANKDEPCNFAVPLEMCLKESKPFVKHEFNLDSIGFLGFDEESQSEISVKLGPFGYYISADGADGRNRRVSLPINLALESIDLNAAKLLLSMPLTLGLTSDMNEISLDVDSYGLFVQSNAIRARLPLISAVAEFKFEDAQTLLSEKGYKSKRSGAKQHSKLKKRSNSSGKNAGNASKSNPFINFMKDKKEEVKEANPDKSWHEILQIIGKEWSESSEEIRSKYA